MTDRITPYPLRMPPELRSALEERAKESGRSLNTEIIELITSGIEAQSPSLPNNTPVKIIPLGSGRKRIAYGSLLSAFNIDFNQDLSELKTDIETTLEFLKNTSFLVKFSFITKDIKVYQGNNHLDIINAGEKSVGWLTVEDHLI